MKTGKKLIFSLIFLTLITLVTLLSDIFLDVVGVNRDFRLVYPDRIHRNDYHLLFIERSNLSMEVPIYPLLVSPDDKKVEPYIRWQIKTNSRGMNDREFASEKMPGTIRVVALGDSCTFGWAVDRDLGYVRIIERELRNSFPEEVIELLNAGHSGYSTFQGHVLLDRYVRAWQPDIITICFGFNDRANPGGGIPDSVAFKRQQSFWGTVRYNLERSNWFMLGLRGMLAYKARQKIIIPSDTGIRRVSLEEFGANLASFVSTGKELGATVVFITQQHQSWNELFDQYYHMLNRIADEHQVPVVDCAVRFRELQQEYNITTEIPNRLYIDNGIHPQPEGHEVIGKMVSETLRNIIRLKWDLTPALYE